MELIIEDDIQL